MSRRDPLPARELAAALLVGAAIGLAIGYAAWHRPGRHCCDPPEPVAFDWTRLPCPVPGHRD